MSRHDGHGPGQLASKHLRQPGSTASLEYPCGSEGTYWPRRVPKDLPQRSSCEAAEIIRAAIRGSARVTWMFRTFSV